MITIHIEPTETNPREGGRVVEQTQHNRKGLTKIIWGIILILALSILGGIILIKATLIFKPSPQSAYVRTRMYRVISNPIRQACSTEETRIGANPSGCSIFTVSKGAQVFFGGNDDYYNPDSYYWVDPGGVQGYGAIWIGKPDNLQQGVNEKGLAYDANGLPRVDVNPHLERRPVSGDYSSYPIQILHECSTVEEVITWVNTHQWHFYMHDQMHFADATNVLNAIHVEGNGSS